MDYKSIVVYFTKYITATVKPITTTVHLNIPGLIKVAVLPPMLPPARDPKIITTTTGQFTWSEKQK